MSAGSKIEWTSATWNPTVGCSIVSPGCTNCYAMRMASRIDAMQTGSHYAGTTKKVNGKAVWTGKVERSPKDILTAPLRWKRPRRIFVNSMSDLFHESIPDEWIDGVFAVMALCPQHTFQVLTKRAERMRSYCTSLSESEDHFERFCDTATLITNSPEHHHLEDVTLPLPNVWNGVSAERQQEADERITHLLATPASVRFVSAEPLLDRIDLQACGAVTTQTPGMEPAGCIDWLIVGGESGPGARTMHVEWVDSIVEQCKAAGVACFVKQLGSAPSSSGYPLHLRSSKGGDQNEWPKRLRVREFPR